uniref:Putative C2H2-like zinc finger protein n=1 Tax=Davidia involucrata TaxID=16924 RepID=A0A5B7B3L0_DAVIN
MYQSSYLPMVGVQSSTIPSSEAFPCFKNGFTTKRKRRPAGTPDPDAEVVSLSPETLLESDRYVCEICNQGFQREQNLQMHRRRHKVPWKLLKREAPDVRKRVYVCPEPTCLHHDPCHALGDLVGIKKHFRRKHSNHKEWVCERCSKGYAVQSDYKAHLKTCGTRGHSCDCGRVFSRVESFIEHQDTCKPGTIKPVLQAPKPAYLLQTSLSPPFPINTNFSTPSTPPNSGMSKQQQKTELISPAGCEDHSLLPSLHHNLKLQLLTSSSDKDSVTQLKLSIGSLSNGEKNESNSTTSCLNLDANYKACSMESFDINIEEPVVLAVQRLKDEAREELRMAMEEKAFAEERRRQANWQIELAKQELTNAKEIREQALVELNKARVLKECATEEINSNILQITCNGCKRRFQAMAKPTGCGDQHYSPVLSYGSSAITEGDGENGKLILWGKTHYIKSFFRL